MSKLDPFDFTLLKTHPPAGGHVYHAGNYLHLTLKYGHKHFVVCKRNGEFLLFSYSKDAGNLLEPLQHCTEGNFVMRSDSLVRITQVLGYGVKAGGVDNGVSTPPGHSPEF